MTVITDTKKIDAILTRGVIVDIFPGREAFRDLLLSGRKLKFYIGADPTSTALHLSHAKNYLLLEEFRQLGHEVIVLFGDFTARIGDPSGEFSKRKQLSSQDVEHNVKGWIKQIRPLLDFSDKHNPPKVVYNSEWLAKLNLAEVLGLAANFTVQQMLERDMFQKRIKNNSPVHLHEFLYPLMQGYDSVAMKVDVELCGTDQTFNALAGRTLVKKLQNREKFVVTVNLMENPKTGELMSKSKGTGVFLDSPANDMYGAIMAQPDEMIEILLVNNTRLPLEEIKKLNIAANPRATKAKAAYEVVKIFYGKNSAQIAEQNFEKQFKKREMPEDIKEVTLNKTDTSGYELVFLLVSTGLSKSNQEARRLITQGGVKVNGAKQEENDILKIENGDIIQVGKRKFAKIILQ